MKEKLLYYSQIQINGITKQKERQNWENGINTLHDLYNAYGQQLSLFFDNPILESINALSSEDVVPFIKGLDKSEYYRIAYSFPERVLFIDIETTGLSKVYSYITVIGWYFNGEYKHILCGNDLALLIDDLDKTDVIITFNGSLFDLPFIKFQYPELADKFDRKAHIDLRFFLKRYGYTGGQKEIEDRLGFKRPEELKNADGREAISLWYRFLKGDNNSLGKLLYYNCYDMLGMVYLFNYVFFNDVYGKIIPRFGDPVKFSYRFRKAFIKFDDSELTKSRNHVKTKTTFFKHSFLNESYTETVIGIDLTGSENKASGCAVISGNIVKTDLIFSDADLIEYILRNKASIVSIDSPLSLPYGRTSVFDDDPMRDEIGIMRYCERVLKRRGVNVYPSLIPSMQKLTKRGIELAGMIRKLGIPVIESFPGAAQDVLQIPRKKTDLFFLKQGLIDFGLTGEFGQKSISHDELDAITSALVGQFYISNYYEALGNVEEDYLIIPAITKCKAKKKQVIGICGPISTGKTELARYIEKKGYSYIRYSMIIADYLLSKGIDANRENLQKYGYIIFSEYGQYWLNKRLLSKLSDDELVVIDGLRHPEDIAFLKENFFSCFKAVYIESDFEIRKHRYAADNSEEYNKIISHDVEKNIGKLRELSHYCISNNGTKEELYNKINDIILI